MKIADVRTMLLSSPIPPERRWRSDFGSSVKSDAAIVVVETDEGITGYGEAKGTPLVVKAIVETRLKPALVGQDPTRVEYLWERMYSGSRTELALKYGHPYHGHNVRGETACAISGVDVALWDIFGTSLGVPIFKLLGGGVRERVRAYGSGGWAGPGAAGQELAGYVEKGFGAVKMRVGGLDDEDFPTRSVDRLREVRAAIGPKVDLMMDAHGALTARQAVELALRAEELRISWFEEPVVVADDLPGLAEVRSRTTIPIATGENESTRFAFQTILDARAADILQPDIAIAGGLTETRRIAALAHARGLVIAPHVWGSALLWAASLQFAAATPNCAIFEFCQAYSPLLYGLLTTPVAVGKDGFVGIPTGPGLGVELQPDLEKKYPYVETTVFPL
ncbi:MAG TPA: mandelate racemase/muconate lactonizing enzyme family protein [Chloroflexota bacterium]|nr:mandelate racemase/muconate lactonizing enzyme family protein [Chloroflexota bacterium]